MSSADCRSSSTPLTAPPAHSTSSGSNPSRWDTEDETVGGVLAAHAASAILANQQERQLKTALRTRDRIGQAKGIIMQRFGVDDVKAFNMLRR